MGNHEAAGVSQNAGVLVVLVDMKLACDTMSCGVGTIVTTSCYGFIVLIFYLHVSFLNPLHQYKNVFISYLTIRNAAKFGHFPLICLTL